MTIARTRRPAATLPRPRSAKVEIDDDSQPTRLYARDERVSDVVRVAARDVRWQPPSLSFQKSPRPLHVPPITPLRGARAPAFSVGQSRAIISAIVDELPPLATADASRPVSLARALAPLAATPNVFLAPPRTTDPPPPWPARRSALAPSVTSVTTAPRRRGSTLPLFAAALALGIGLGLWHDESARAGILTDLAHVAAWVAAFLAEKAAHP